MKQQPCEIASKEELVAYADGDLSPSEAKRIAEHITTCPDCKAMAEALEFSLLITQAIWQSGRSQWTASNSSKKISIERQSFRKSIAVAASILLALISGVLWQLLSGQDDHTHTVNNRAKIVELRIQIAESSHAAQLLAAAELLNKYPRVQKQVKERYRHIIETYPKTAAAKEAKLKMQ